MTNLMVVHGNPTQAASPYNPITPEQLAASGLAYLALGLSEDVELLLRRCELPAVVLLLLREQLRVAGIQL